MKKVYLDNAATTPVAPEVFEEMVPYLRDMFGNPSSQHSFGRQAKGVLETARRKVANYLNAKPSEIVFTSGGTEADNMVFNIAANELNVERFITSEIEHHAVLHTAEHICSKRKVELQIVKLLPNGHVDLQHLEKLLASSNKKTLVSLMHGNNEIGNLLPLKKVSELCRKHNSYFHSDTVQTMAHYKFDLQALDVDFLTCSAHKFHGPKGIGFLYINSHVKAVPMIHGGSQERGLRGGTENLYSIVGLAKAMELAYTNLEEHQIHVQGLKSYMKQELIANIPDVTSIPFLTTVPALNVSLPATSKAAMLLFTLDLKGVACSGGSACSSGSSKGSHVLEGIQADTSRPNVRFSFSRYNTKDDVDFAVNVLKEAYSKDLVH